MFDRLLIIGIGTFMYIELIQLITLQKQLRELTKQLHIKLRGIS